MDGKIGDDIEEPVVLEYKKDPGLCPGDESGNEIDFDF